MRFPGNVAICSHRFLTLGRIRVGERRQLRVAPLFPEAVAAPSTLYTRFTNANGMLHVANCVARTDRERRQL
jgi:hypothetical protein